MSQWQQLQFEHITGLLHALGAEGNAAEGHGMLCGLLCSKGYVNSKAWIGEMVDQDGTDTLEMPPDAAPESLPGALLDLHSETVRRINDLSYEFHLMLPDDEEGLETRVAALAQWCQGFLYGMGIGGMEDFSKLPAPVAEIARDLIEISRASAVTDGSEEDETAFAELVEYIRVGVQVIYEELQPVPPGKDETPTKPTLH
jgi:yecA family protein